MSPVTDRFKLDYVALQTHSDILKAGFKTSVDSCSPLVYIKDLIVHESLCIIVFIKRVEKKIRCEAFPQRVN